MMRKLLYILLLSGSIACAQTCPQQTWVPIEPSPMAVDPNQVAVDPDTGQPAFLGWLLVIQNVPWSIVGAACDPQGTSLTFASDKYTLTPDPNGPTFTLSGISTELGPDYVNISVTNTPDPEISPPYEPMTTTGTALIIVLPPFQRPRLWLGENPQ